MTKFVKQVTKTAYVTKTQNTDHQQTAETETSIHESIRTKATTALKRLGTNMRLKSHERGDTSPELNPNGLPEVPEHVDDHIAQQEPNEEGVPSSHINPESPSITATVVPSALHSQSSGVNRRFSVFNSEPSLYNTSSMRRFQESQHSASADDHLNANMRMRLSPIFANAEI